ncbi:glycosyltransferase family 2 protein [Roseovarius arcticus]|uniref:glycosyltransferase family 2 protein n=1 Tax=Roseovarius arcticus TaxID=2547404 RepID=UPI001110EB91|nr:glycosyltransferase [Roseovarius arcticus]
MELRLLMIFSLLFVCVLVPAVGVILCGAILALQIMLMSLRPMMAGRSKPASDVGALQPIPVFSIHVATHSEPPAVVIRTLQSLLNQDWTTGAFEVIVMDNNTQDIALWGPVEAFCSQHPGRLTFLHRLGVVGAKAGALNIALDHTRADATHVVTVDADYIVQPDFLSIAASALGRTGADYVQFPQSYRLTDQAAAGVDAELEEYFRSNAIMADDAEAVLLTGTLCVISRRALVAVGGWSGATTTEDAELGVRLCHAGYSGRFINEVVGQGLLPLSLRDLEKQRYRWCSGNLRTLLRHLPIITGHASSLNIQQRLVVITQLTAWFNLALVPAILLLAALLLDSATAGLVAFASATIVLCLLDVVLRVAERGINEARSLSTILAALACRIALAPQSAKATLDGVIGGKLQFIVTNKSGDAVSRYRTVPIGHVALFVLSLCALIAAEPHHILVIAALITLMLPLPAALFTARNLRSYRASISLDAGGATA